MIGGQSGAPPACGKWVASVPLPALPAFVDQAAAALSASLAQTQAQARRAEARAEIEARARLHTLSVDDAASPPRSARAPWVVAGHQPEFFHPGVWVKGFVLDALCRERDVVGLYLVADAAPARAGVSLPAGCAGRWRRADVTLPGVGEGVAWEAQPPLSADGWRALLASVRATLSSSRASAFETFATIVARSPAVSRATTLGDSLSRSRRVWESTDRRPSYLELPVSVMCDTRAFHQFVADVLARLPEFVRLHNACLASWRARRGPREMRPPVADLGHADEGWEAPFWCMRPDGRRARLFLSRAGRGWIVRVDGEALGRLSEGHEADWPEHLRQLTARAQGSLRPRALTLTMFARGVLGDVFLHGLGGDRYERAAQPLAETFFGRPFAPWAVVSTSLCVAGDGPDALCEGRPHPRAPEIRRALRDLVHNPQRFAPSCDLTLRKAALVEAMQQAGGPHKRALTDEIDAVNAALRGSLRPCEETLLRRLAEAEIADAEAAILHGRDYPWFLFNAFRIRRAVEGQGWAIADGQA